MEEKNTWLALTNLLRIHSPVVVVVVVVVVTTSSAIKTVLSF